MNFRDHSNLKDQHAFFGPSKYSWLNYDENKAIDVYLNHLATLRGTQLHEYAAMSIELRQKLQDVPKTLNMYVNDAIGFNMKPEVILYYSEFFFGTADAIYFSEKTKTLRIHDLKTGMTPAKMEQLLIYTALFCLEYSYKPSELDITLVIYQFDQKFEYKPTAEDIVPIIDKIITFDKILKNARREEFGY